MDMFHNVILARDSSLARQQPFRIQLDPSSIEAGLRLKPAPPPQLPQKRDEYAGVVTRRAAYAFFASQLCVVSILGFMVFTLAVTSFRVTDNINTYYAAFQPYMGEMGNHSLSIMRHADLSSEYLEQVMSQGSATAAASLPAMEASVNRTADMVLSLQRFSQHPTVQMTVV